MTAFSKRGSGVVLVHARHGLHMTTKNGTNARRGTDMLRLPLTGPQQTCGAAA